MCSLSLSLSLSLSVCVCVCDTPTGSRSISKCQQPCSRRWVREDNTHCRSLLSSHTHCQLHFTLPLLTTVPRLPGKRLSSPWQHDRRELCDDAVTNNRRRNSTRDWVREGGREGGREKENEEKRERGGTSLHALGTCIYMYMYVHVSMNAYVYMLYINVHVHMYIHLYTSLFLFPDHRLVMGVWSWAGK